MKRNLYTIVSLVLICLFVPEVSAMKNEDSRNPEISPVQNTRTLFISKPANNSTNVPAPVLKVTANAVSGATRYTIELNTSPDFTETSFIQTSAKDHQLTLTFRGLAYAKTYYARVKTNLSNHYGGVSRFTTRQEEFPIVREPNGLTDANPLLMKVVVGTIPDAKRYTVELSRKSNFSGPSIILSGSADDENEFIFKNLAHSTTYYTRAKSDISTTYGPVTSFRTREKIKQKRLWGLTTAGGEHASGTVFSFSVDSSTFTKHHDYIETSDYPYSYLRGSLTPAPDGGFYGNSECEKNGTCANGEVFYISPQGQFELRYTLGVHSGSVMLASNNNLYVVDDWINLFRGGIWKLDAEGSGTYPLEDIIFRFKRKSQGLNPKTPLLELQDGYLYGVTPYGGTNNAGTIFRLNRNGKEFQVLHHFDGAGSGANPNGSLTIGEDGYLYGTTAFGGTSDRGVLFKILPEGKGYKKLYEFKGLNGKHPLGNLLHDGDVLYGMTSEGGDYDKGVLFSLKTNGSSYKKLLDFNGENGAHPFGTPAMDNEKMLFAMTSQGGKHDMGVIFKMKTNGSAYSKLFDFSEESGGNPDGNLLFMEDSFLPKTGLAARFFNGLPHKVGLYPNPFVRSLTAQIEGENQQSVKFILTDLQGNVLQEVIGETNSDLELGSELGRGIYILKVIKGEEMSLHRIVKK